MGTAARRRRRKAHRAYEAREAAVAADRAIAAANRASEALATPACPITDVSTLLVSPADIERASRFEANEMVWYVARCGPQAERRAVMGLRERRLAAYSPVERRWSWVRGRKRLSVRPLFVGYVFVGVARGQSVYSVMQVSGIEGIVESFGRKAVVDPWTVFALATAELAGQFDHTGPKRPVFSKGQEVKVVSGQFAGFIARVVEATGDRLRILFEAGLFKGSPFPVDEGQVAAVNEREAA